MTNKRSAIKHRPVGRRARARHELDELVDGGELTLDERLHIEAAAVAARDAAGARPTSTRRPGT